MVVNRPNIFLDSLVIHSHPLFCLLFSFSVGNFSGKPEPFEHPSPSLCQVPQDDETLFSPKFIK